jgi:hypothetical protein
MQLATIEAPARGRWAATAGLALLLPLAAHAAAGSFTRLSSDTYCHAALLQAHGLWGMLAYHYNIFAGRYTLYLLEGLSVLAGPAVFPLPPGLAVLLWLGGLVAVLWPQVRERWRALLLGALALVATLDASPAVPNVLYWTTGMHNYVAPLALLTWLAALIGWRARQPAAGRAEWVWRSAAFALAFLAAGGSEMVGVLQLAALVAFAAAGLLASSQDRRRLLPIVAAALLGAALGFGLVAAAPGNAVRRASQPPVPTPLALAGLVGGGTFISAGIAAKAGPLGLLTAVALPAVLGSQDAGWLRGRLRTRGAVAAAVLGVPAVTAVLIAASLVPPAYGLAGLPPSRAILVVAFVLVPGLMAWGYVLGQLLGPRLAPRLWLGGRGPALGAAALCLYALLETVLVVRPLPRLARFAEQWDHNYALIQAAVARGDASVTVPAIDNPLGVVDIGTDPTLRVTPCMAAWYGVEVRSEPQPTPPGG